MSTNKSSEGKRFVRHRKPNDPPPKDPFLGGSFDYIEGGETSNHRHRGHRHEEEDGGRENDRPPFATIPKERRKHRESHAISSEAIAENHREQTRRAAPQTPVPLSGDRGAPSGHGRGGSDTGSYVRERPAPNKYSRGEKVVSFKEPPASSRYSSGESDTDSFITAPSIYGRGESDTGSYIRERPAPSIYGRGESDTGSYIRERPAPKEHSRGEKVVSFKEQPAPSRYGRGKYNTGSYFREQPAPSRHGRGEHNTGSYFREQPAPSKHGRGESEIVTYIRKRPAAGEQPQRPDAHQMAGDRAPSLNLGRDLGLPALRPSNSERRRPAHCAGNKLLGDPKSPPTPRRDPKPKETPSQDNRGSAQPETRLYKRVVDPPSLAGFSRFVSPPYSCNKSIDFPPPRGKYEMSGALETPPSVERRPRSPAERERLASNGDIVRNKHRGNRHSSNSDGSNGSARGRGRIVQINQNMNVVLEGHRGSRGKGRLIIKN